MAIKETEGLARLKELYGKERAYRQATDTRGEFRKGLSAGVDQTQALFGGAVAAVGDAAGIDSLADYGMDVYDDNMHEADQSAGAVGRVEDIDGVGSALQWATYQLGRQLPTLGSMAATGGVTGGIAKVAGQKALKGQIAKRTAALIKAGATEQEAARLAAKVVVNKFAKKAANSAVLATGTALSTGEIAGSLKEETGEIHGGLALLGGSVAGMLEAAPIMRIFNRVGIDANKAGGAIQRSSMAEVRKKLANVGKGASKQAAVESITEGLQTIVERATVNFVADNYDIFGADGVSDIINAMASGAIVGGAIGIPGHISESLGQPATINRASEAENQLTDLEDKISTLSSADVVDEAVLKDLNGQHEKIINDRIDEIKQTATVEYAESGDQGVIDTSKQSISDLRTRLKATVTAQEQAKAEKAAAETATKENPKPAAKPASETPTQDKSSAVVEPDGEQVTKEFGQEQFEGYARLNKDELDTVLKALSPGEQRKLGQALKLPVHKALRLDSKSGEVLIDSAQYYRAIQKYNKGEPPAAAPKPDDSAPKPKKTKAREKAEQAFKDSEALEGDIVSDGGLPFKTKKRAQKRLERLKKKGQDGEVVPVGPRQFVVRPTNQESVNDNQKERNTEPSERSSIVKHDEPKAHKTATHQGTPDQLQADAKPENREAPPNQGESGDTGTAASRPSTKLASADGVAANDADSTASDQTEIAKGDNKVTEQSESKDAPAAATPETVDKPQKKKKPQAKKVAKKKASKKKASAKKVAKKKTSKKAANKKPEPKKPATDKPAEPSKKPTKGANNKVFTADAADAAREVLRKKLSNLNSGIDPEVLQAGLTLAGFHIESGARSFTDYAKAMVEDLGDGIKPYLKSFYNGVRDYPGMEDIEFTDYNDVRSVDIDLLLDEAEQPKVKSKPERESESQPSKVTTDAALDDSAALAELFPAIQDQMDAALEAGMDAERIRSIVEPSYEQGNRVRAINDLERAVDQLQPRGIGADPEPEQKTSEPEVIAEEVKKVDTSPTDAQKEAGNYKKAHFKWQGWDVAIENPKDSKRTGIAANGERWENTMGAHYGDLKGKKGADGDPLDIFLGESIESDKVWVIDQAKPDGTGFDEHKIMAGFKNKMKAKKAYMSSYDKDWKGLGSMTLTTPEKLREWIENGDMNKPFFASETKAPAKVKAKPATETETQPDFVGELTKALNVQFDEITNNLKLKKLVAGVLGVKNKDVTLEQMKQAQELYEQKAVLQAHQVVSDNPSDAWNSLIKMNKRAPRLDVRSGDSRSRQAYSTPHPMAYLTSQLAGIDTNGTVLDNSAGHGALQIGANLDKTSAIELDPKRAEFLRARGFSNVLEQSALDENSFGNDFDHYIANPPFGKMDSPVMMGEFSFKQIDHAIVAKGLEQIKDDGTAAFIIGANRKVGEPSAQDKVFFRWLYGNYNVVDHVEADGKLYAKQGAGWPVRIITVRGRAKSDRIGPKIDTIQRLDSWEALHEHSQAILNSDQGALVARADTISERLSGAAAAELARLNGLADSKSSTDTNGRTQGKSTRNNSDTGRARTSTKSSGSVGARRDDAGNSDKRAADARTVSAGQLENTDTSIEGTAKPGTDTKQRTGGDSTRTAKPANRRVAEQDDDLQTLYQSASGNNSNDALVPSNMAEPLQQFFDEMRKDVGDIDAYVKDRLGYTDDQAYTNAFMGLQVDGVAAAIYNHENGEKGVILADQTGMGKGRQAAAMIRYAHKIGKTPVFITVKPNLFTDMYDDSHDIDSKDIKPFILNASQSIVQDDGNGNVTKLHKSGAAKKQKDAMASILKDGKLPDDANVLFATYSQFNKPNVQREVLEKLGKNAFLILDEAHEMAGIDRTAKKVNGQMQYVETTGGFIKRITNDAPTTYLSATYAKRPDNMTAFTRTSIADAIPQEEEGDDKPGFRQADVNKFAQLIAKGGAPLQAVIAHELTRKGQLIRRERSFAGINIAADIDSSNIDRDVQLSDALVKGLTAIAAADKLFHGSTVKDMRESLKGAGTASGAGNRASSTVDHSNFNSVLHNYVGQLMLGLKADYTADRAIELHNQGIKPVIALESTMGSFIEDAAKNSGLKAGDAFELDYKSILHKALERTRRLSIKSATGSGKPKVIDISKSELSEGVLAAYEKAEAIIDSLDLAAIPVSPIDHMKAKLEKAGISVGEITGRRYTVDYSGDSPVLGTRSPKEIKERRSTVDAFQNGQTDALILNKAGSTGLSAHNSTKLPEEQQKKRHMLVAQMSGDINILMQMLGRINRTGQRNEPDMLPEYSIIGASVPAEKRIMAAALKKLSSLNANTSANTEGSTTFDAPDFLNLYGDEVVADYLQTVPELASRLELHISEQAETSDSENQQSVHQGLASKATGRLAAYATNAEQVAFYEAVEAAYAERIAYQDSIGDNKLKTATLDMQAEIIESKEIVEQGDESNSGISGRAVLHKVNAKQLQKPPTPKIVNAAIKKALGKGDQDSYAKKVVDSNIDNAAATKLIQQLQNKYNSTAKLLDVSATESTDHAQLKELSSKLSEKAAAIGDALDKKQRRAVEELASMARSYKINQIGDRTALESFMELNPIGKTVNYKFEGGTEQGMITGYQVKQTDKGNPYAPSQIKLELMMASPTGKINVPLSKARKSMSGAVNQTVEELFDTSKDNSGFEERLVVTGNLLAGLDKVSGQIVRFTDKNNSTHQGILLPRYAELDTDAVSDDSFMLKDMDAAVKFFKQQKTGTVIDTNAEGVSIEIADVGYVLKMAKSGSTKATAVQKDASLGLMLGADNYTNSGMRHYELHIATGDLKKLLGRLSGSHGIKAVANESQRQEYIDAGGSERASVGQFDVSLSKQTANKGMSVKAVQRIVNRVAKRINADNIKVLDSIKSLPDYDKYHNETGIAGLYDKRNNTIYVFADANATPLAVEQLLLHETQHNDTKDHYGKDTTSALKFLGMVIEQDAGSIKAFVDKYDIDYNYDWYEADYKKSKVPSDGRKVLHADELLAKLAERKATLPGRVRMAINRVMAMARRWLRQNGFNVTANLGMDELVIALHDISSARHRIRQADTGIIPSDSPVPESTLDTNQLPEKRAYSFSKVKGGIGQIAKERGLNRQPLIADKGADPESRKQAIVDDILSMSTENVEQTEREKWQSFMQSKYAAVKDVGRTAVNKMLSRRQLVEWGQKYLPRMTEYLRVAEQLDADRRSLQVEGNDIAVEWGTLAEDQQAELAKMMQSSTVAGIDPSKPYEPLFDPAVMAADMKRLKSKERAMQEARTPEGTGPLLVEIEALKRLQKQEANRKKAYPDIMNQWNKLDASTKAVYENARDHHAKQAAEYEQAVHDQIMGEIGTSRAKEKTWSKIKAEFDKNKIQEPYFPLARFGKYWVTVRYSDQPDDYSFDKFDDLDGAATFIADMQDAGHQVKWGTDLNKAVDSLAVPTSFMVQVDELLDTGKKKDRADPMVEQLRDSVYQLYLDNLPAMSARHRHQHRKEVRGFSQDALKSFADASFHGSYLVARTRHMPKLERILSDIEADIKESNRIGKTIEAKQDLENFRDHYFEKVTTKEIGQELRLTKDKARKRELRAMKRLSKEIRSDEDIATRLGSLNTRIESAAKINESPYTAARASEYLDELRGSHERMAKPTVSKLVTTINSLGFGFFLGLTPASALINMAQVPMVTMPILGAKYGNKVAWQAIQKAYGEFFNNKSGDKFATRSIRNGLNGREAAAFDELARRGVIDVTQAHDLAGLAEEGQQFGGKTQKIMRVMSWAFHHAERVNREVTAMASYRLARANGMDHLDAIDEAGAQTWKTQLDYGSTNRAAVLSSNFARVALQFKQYSAGITFLYVDAFRQAFGKHADADTKAEARRALKSLLGVQFAVTGGLGMPLASSTGAVIESIVHAFSEEDDFDYEAGLRQGLTDLMRPVLGDTMARKAQTALTKGAIDGFSPISIHGRLSLSELWVRSPWKDLEGRDAAVHYLTQLAGPTYGLAENTAHGMSLMLDGELYRGVEAMSPKFLRDTMKAGRYVGEGATTGSGNLIADINPVEAAAQLMGFSPSSLSNQYDENRAKSKRQSAMTKYRSGLLRDVVDARRDRDRKAERDLMNAIREFNKRHPEYPITGKSIKLSDKGRTRASSQTEQGFRANRSMKGVLDSIDFGS